MHDIRIASTPAKFMLYIDLAKLVLLHGTNGMDISLTFKNMLPGLMNNTLEVSQHLTHSCGLM